MARDGAICLKFGKLLICRCMLVLLALMIVFSISNVVCVWKDCQRVLNRKTILKKKETFDTIFLTLYFSLKDALISFKSLEIPQILVLLCQMARDMSVL